MNSHQSIVSRIEKLREKIEAFEETIREQAWRGLAEIQKELIAINMLVEDLLAENVEFAKRLNEKDSEPIIPKLA